jgi:hypothetical protein
MKRQLTVTIAVHKDNDDNDNRRSTEGRIYLFEESLFYKPDAGCNARRDLVIAPSFIS